MCGITGYIDLNGHRAPASQERVIQDMSSALRHRGPDDSGVWQDAGAGVWLAHRRLSILDVSARGHQPMVSESGRFILTYNGEIYNHEALRKQVLASGSVLRGTSDTETILATIERLGVEKGVRELKGMFAFALWDRQRRVLTLARDRIGEKPLYYGWIGEVFGFASELKALRRHPEWHGSVDQNALRLLLQYGYVPTPECIYKGCRKLPPGTMLELTHDNIRGRSATSSEPDGDWPRPVKYWALGDAGGGCQTLVTESDEQIVDELTRRLRTSVRGQMVSDVPLGALLSGGMDSTLITALMQNESSLPVKTFTIGFEEAQFNEAVYAKEVARYLGTDHTEMYVTSAEARDVIPLLPDMYDEPFADSSQIPMHIVSRLARSDVTVALSGDGGDELFGGYARYAITEKLWRRVNSVPYTVRRLLSMVMKKLPLQARAYLMRWIATVVSTPVQLNGGAEQFLRLADLLEIREFDKFYDSMISHWKRPDDLVVGGDKASVRQLERGALLPVDSPYRAMMFADIHGYLPDDILTKVDRASMAVGLEVRAPFLDHELVEWAWELPTSFKIRGVESKYVIKKALQRYVPNELVERPKMGFGVPIGEWLRGPLRDWAEDLLAEQRLRDEGYFYPGPIREAWRQHLSGKANLHYYLWDVLMFQAWRKASV